MGPIENVDWSSGGIVRQFKMKYTETNNIRFLKPSKNSYLGIDGVAIHMSAKPNQNVSPEFDVLMPITLSGMKGKSAQGS